MQYNINITGEGTQQEIILALKELVKELEDVGYNSFPAVINTKGKWEAEDHVLFTSITESKES